MNKKRLAYAKAKEVCKCEEVVQSDTDLQQILNKNLSYSKLQIPWLPPG